MEDLLGLAAQAEQENRPLDVVRYCNEAIRLNPQQPEIYLKLGLVLFGHGHYREALACSRRALALRPDDLSLRALKAGALRQCQRFDEAAEAFAAALELAPDNARSMFGQGLSLMGAGRPQEALEKFQQARAADPKDEDIRMGFSDATLCVGDFATGWSAYSARLKRFPAFSDRKLFPGERWGGEKITGSLLLAYERQLDDLVLFLRYAQLARSRCEHLTVQAPKAALSLVTAVPGVDAALDFAKLEGGKAVGGFDRWAPIGSLPAFLNADPITTPTAFPYLKIPQDRADRARRWLADLPGDGPRVGICWADAPGSPRGNILEFTKILPVLRFPAPCFVALQRGERGEDPVAAGVSGLLRDARPLMGDLLDTAALIAGLDLLISCDASLVSIAGALAVPVWSLTDPTADWRRRCGPDGKPLWYPAARAFPQHSPGVWDQAVADLCAALDERFQLTPSA